MSRNVPAKDPNSIEPYFFVFCDETGINNGSANDQGELQGATIATREVVADIGLTVESTSLAAVTIRGVTYPINTVVTAWLSGGTDGNTYTVRCRIATSDNRTLDISMRVPVAHL